MNLTPDEEELKFTLDFIVQACIDKAIVDDPLIALEVAIDELVALFQSEKQKNDNRAMYLLHSILSDDVDSTLDHSDIEQMFSEALKQTKEQTTAKKEEA